MVCRHDAFEVVGTTLPGNIGVFHASSLKMVLISSNASQMDRVPRPGHADYTYQVKYGIRAASGGGAPTALSGAARAAGLCARVSFSVVLPCTHAMGTRTRTRRTATAGASAMRLEFSAAFSWLRSVRDARRVWRKEC